MATAITHHEHFRTLCCLGLGAREMMPLLMRGLHEVVPSTWNRIALGDADNRPVSTYAEHPGFYPKAWKHWYELMSTPGSIPSIVPLVAAAGGIGWTLHKQDARYLDSAFYHEVEKPLDSCWMLDAVMVYDGKPVAGMILARSRSDRPFNVDDVATIDRVRPWIAYALRPRGPDEPIVLTLSDADDLPVGTAPLVRATVMMNARGDILYRSQAAAHLFMILNGMIDDPRSLAGMRRERVPECLRVLCQRISETARGALTRPPHLKLRTSWGVITLHGCWLAPVNEDPLDVAADPLGLPIIITIELLETPAAHAMRVLKSSGATPTQTRVGMLMALGRSKPEIARELGVKTSSVEDAARKLYERLDISGAPELARKVWLHSHPSAGQSAQLSA
jgi:DNA-binding CsgD family transcriptional regulator